ncbi:imelysin family protein [Sulfurimonas marina]|uniref:Imelysin-like domain-containing protein n=1 Tax=Sulfurimonas marina TaxID=2590551 RepID=A0A7M1AXL0_9BACT|nr:imelysin family protein [Sulfurimonas marina]QOP42180.1 hypothetical protein FJR03_10705 [Sulfurimonas marina]
MKLRLKIISVLALILFFIGCNGDNAYDGENGLKSGEFTSDIESSLSFIYALLQEDANQTYTQAQELAVLLEDVNNSVADLQNAQEKFLELVSSYKKVEALYVADEYENIMQDPPRYLEYFHSITNSELVAELDLILSGSDPIADALAVKNLYRSITALEYILFGVNEEQTTLLASFDERRTQAAIIMAQNIAANLQTINEFYEQNSAFLEDSDSAISVVVNQLVDSAYKTKEWRVGDGAGFTLKYKDNPDAARLEYYNSRYSLEAIDSILAAHQELMDSGFKELAIIGGATSEAEAIESKLVELRTICAGIEGSLSDSLTDEKVYTLYVDLNALQNNYTALINALNFTQDIIEADGD